MHERAGDSWMSIKRTVLREIWSSVAFKRFEGQKMAGILLRHTCRQLKRQDRPVSYTHLDVYKRQAFDADGEEKNINIDADFVIQRLGEGAAKRNLDRYIL